MVGYSYTSTLEPVYKYVEIYDNGTYGQVRVSKDVIFDINIDFRLPIKDTCIPESILSPPGTPSVPTSSTPLALPVTEVPHEPPPPPQPPEPDPLPDPEIYPDTLHLDDMGNPLYWYALSDLNSTQVITLIQVSHHVLVLPSFDKRVPRTYLKAMQDPLWRAAIKKETDKFSLNECFKLVLFIGQHLVPMMWIFAIKTDGTYKARLVGRGDLMIPGVDFDPDAVYCGNVTACSIKMCLSIAAKYKLTMRGGDLEGAYLVTRANAEYPVFIKTPQGYEDFVPKGHCIQAVGNLY
jgi:hypothetical protein